MAKGISARSMSLDLGRNAGYINTMENKKSWPSFPEFFYICERLGVTPDEFFDEGNQAPERLREIVKDLKRLDPEQLKNIAAIIKAMQK